MAFRILSLLFLLSALVPSAQGHSPLTQELARYHGPATSPINTKMPCGANDAPLMVFDCEGESELDSDGNPSNGVLINWRASGADTLYYSQFLNAMDTFTIINNGRIINGEPATVYEAEDDGVYILNNGAGIRIATPTGAGCIPRGFYTVRLWSVRDENNDGQPDRDPVTNEIIGCFVECDLPVDPPCSTNTSPAFTIQATDETCDGNDGALRPQNITASRFYCFEASGVTWSWTGPDGFTANTQNITNLAAGDYTVSATDAYGCSNVVEVTLESVPELSIECEAIATPTSPFASNGQATITISDGVGPFDISFSGPVTGSRNNVSNGVTTLTGLAPGTYTVTVSDDETGCTQQCSFTIEPAACTIQFEVTYEADAAGIISVFINPTSGFPNFEVEYTGPTNSTGPISPVPFTGITLDGDDFTFGTYTFVLRESFRPDCFTEITIEFEMPDCSDILVTELETSPPTCFNGMDGLIEVVVTGGENPEISWTGPGGFTSTASQLDNLAAGTYEYTVIDDRNCSVPGMFTLTAPAPITLSCVGVNETANDNNDGKIGINVTGGTAPYQLTYTAEDNGGNPLPGGMNIDLADGDTLRNLQAGTYTLTVTDVNGCEQMCTSVITQPDCDITLTCTPSNPTVFGGTGSVSITSALQLEFSYDIFTQPGNTIVASNFVTDGMAVESGLPPGMYTVSAFDFGGCTGECSFTIEAAPCALTADAAPSPISCAGAEDGRISVEVTGATTGLDFDWNVDALDGMATVTNLAAGTYTVLVSDDGGCPLDPISITLDDPATITLAIEEVVAIECGGDAGAVLRVSTENAVEPIEYNWSVDTFPNSPVVSMVAAGTYSVQITDANGCTGSGVPASITVTEPAPLTLNCTGFGENLAGANDGRIGFDFAGGTPPYRFELNGVEVARPPMDTFRMLPPGEYTLELFDANDCSISCVSSVFAGGCGAFSTTLIVTQPNCFNAGGAIEAMVNAPNGAVSFLWSTGATTQTINDLAPGPYCVTVTDAADCTAEECIDVVPFTGSPEAAIESFSPVCGSGCTDININFTGQPPFQIAFEIEGAPAFPAFGSLDSPGAALTATLCPADFGLADFSGASFRFVAISDNGGCVIEIDELRAIPTSTIALNQINETRCPGDTLFIDGRNFQEDNPVGTFMASQPAASGCDSLIEVILSFFEPATFTLTETLCAGDSLVLGGEVFNESRPSGDVVLENASENGCDSTISVSVQFIAPALRAQNSTICAGSSISVGGQEFTETVVDSLVTFMNPLTGCDSTVLLNLTVLPASSLVLSGGAASCGDTLVELEFSYIGTEPATVMLAGLTGETFTIPVGESTVNQVVPLGTILSIASATSSSGCSIQTSGAVTVGEANFTLDFMEIDTRGEMGNCLNEGEGALLVTENFTGQANPDELFTYAWAGDDRTTALLDNLTSGTYQVTVTNEAGCSVVASYDLNLRTNFELSTAVIPATCVDSLSTLIVTEAPGSLAPYLIRIDDGVFVPADTLPAFIRSPSGTVNLQLEDANGCAGQQSFNLAPADLPELTVSPDFAIVEFGDSVLLTVSTELETDNFTIFPSLDSIIRGNQIWVPATQSGEFIITGRDTLGCSAAATFTLVVDRTAPVYIPTAFSPNLDGTNDRFRLFPSDRVVQVNSLIIFDRWGANVYQLPAPVAAGDENWGWSGERDGQLYPPGVYGYTSTVTLSDGRLATYRGQVSLIR